METQRIELRAGTTPLAFASARELLSALDTSLEEGRGYGDPIVRFGHDDSEPAWLWLDRLLAQRSDWRDCVAVALQHAVVDGDALVRQAFADVLASSRQLAVLEPWDWPLVDLLGPLTVRHAELAWGLGARPPLQAVLAGQQAWLAQIRMADFLVPTEGAMGPKASHLPLRTAADLQTLLQRSAERGKFVETPWGNGPLAWLHLAVLARPWVQAELPLCLERALTGPDALRRVALDWLLDGRDLWRYVQLLDDLVAHHPTWWDEPAAAKPAGWQRPIRVAPQQARTLGHVVAFLRAQAHAQLATPPVLDLPLLGTS